MSLDWKVTGGVGRRKGRGEELLGQESRRVHGGAPDGVGKCRGSEREVCVQAGDSPLPGRGWDGEVLGLFHLVPFLGLPGRTNINMTNLGLPWMLVNQARRPPPKSRQCCLLAALCL